MGQACFCRRNRSKGRILMLGLDSSGKTTILYQMKLKRQVYTTPTVGFNVEDISTCPGTVYTAWDVGGQDRLRTLWKYYFKGTQGLIFVIDSSDRERLDEAKNELRTILEHADMANVPFVLLANKQDMPGALTCEGLMNHLSLNLANRQYSAHPVCAKTGEGLLEAFESLTQLMNSVNTRMRVRLKSSISFTK